MITVLIKPYGLGRGGDACWQTTNPDKYLRVIVAHWAPPLAESSCPTVALATLQTPAPPAIELTLSEAADALGLSVEFVLREIDVGHLPHRLVGTEKRVMVADLAEYERRLRADQEAALDAMAEDARRLGLEY